MAGPGARVFLACAPIDRDVADVRLIGHLVLSVNTLT